MPNNYNAWILIIYLKIGVMRHGRLLVEDSPNVLMAQHKTDLLEDVVLKLCWQDTKMAIRNAPRVGSICPTSGTLMPMADCDDGDSGTGTDNDINEEGGRNSTSDNGDSTDICVAGSSSSGASDGVNDDNANKVNVPSRRVVKPKPPITRSTSSEVCGVLFQSKWKPELDGVVVSDGNCTLRGHYNHDHDFDTFTPANLSCSESLYKTKLGGRRPTGGPKQLLASVMTFTQKVLAFCVVIFLSMIRHPV